MVSAQCPGCKVQLGFYTPSGNWIKCHEAPVEATAPGGSSDGTIATAMSNNASYRFPLILKPATAGCKLNVRFKLGTADGVDKSDGVMHIPITVKDLRTGQKSVIMLGNTDFGTATDLPAASITGVWYDYGATGYAVEAGQEICWGSSPTMPGYLSIEDDA